MCHRVNGGRHTLHKREKASVNCIFCPRLETLIVDICGCRGKKLPRYWVASMYDIHTGSTHKTLKPQILGYSLHGLSLTATPVMSCTKGVEGKKSQLFADVVYGNSQDCKKRALPQRPLTPSIQSWSSYGEQRLPNLSFLHSPACT